MTKKADTPTYSEAIRELEQILAEIENEQVDIDSLSGKISRASVLIRICKSRLYQSGKEIKMALSDLEKENEPTDETMS
jgi:exodeoxyribonuclease VII small subunit